MNIETTLRRKRATLFEGTWINQIKCSYT